MSTISVSNITTANGSEPLTLSTGNTAAGDIIIGATGGVVIASNSTSNVVNIVAGSAANTLVTNSTGSYFTGNVNISALVANGSLGTAGQALFSNASSIYWGTLSTDAIANVNIQVLSGSGTFTPSPGLKYAIVFATGGGGGAGGADAADTAAGSGGGGGGGGSTAIAEFTAAQMTGATYSVGSGGSGGAATGVNGTAGGTTTFTPSSGTALSAGGGALGTGGSAPTVGGSASGGLGGTATGGILNLRGSSGGDGGGDDIAEMGLGGTGGGSFWGPGGGNQIAQGSGQAAGITAVVPGGGGSGAACIDTTAGAAGGGGAAGTIFVLEFMQ